MNIETLVVTDLDGTLWFNGEECHPDSLSAIDQLRNDEIPLLIATGRRLRSVTGPFHSLGISEEAILLNGSVGYDFKNNRNFFIRTFPPTHQERLREIFVACDLSPCFYADDSFVYAASPTTSEGHIEAIGADLITLEDRDSFPADRQILSFCILGVDKSLLEEAESVISSEDLGSIAYYEDRLFGKHSLMVQPPSTSKWTGVKEWCAYYGVTPSKIVAVGDAGNDIELLAGADIALVIEGSEEYLLEMADHTIPEPSEGGWAKVIEFI